jgi:hypothetical protein
MNFLLDTEQASSPAFARRLLPLSLHRTYRSPDDIAERLPANGGVPSEEPSA